MKWFRKYYELKEQNFFYYNKNEYLEFKEKNKYWIEGYALFCVMKEKYANKHWREWPEEIANFQNYPKIKDLEYIVNHPKLQQLLKENEQEVDFFIFLQFLCYQQMIKIKHYAKEKKIFIKGNFFFYFN